MEDLSNIRKQVECPICLGIIREAHVVDKCSHRFCKDCIEKSMRLTNHACPICRIHCPSRRSLKADKKFDKFVASHYPNNNQYEDEELMLNHSEMINNEKWQSEANIQNQTHELSSDDEGNDKSSGDEYIPPKRQRGVRKEHFIRTNIQNVVPNNSEMVANEQWQAETSTQVQAEASTEIQTYELSSDDKSSGEEYVPPKRERARRVRKEQYVGTNEINLVVRESLQLEQNNMPSSLPELKMKNRIEQLVCYFQNLKRTEEEEEGR